MRRLLLLAAVLQGCGGLIGASDDAGIAPADAAVDTDAGPIEVEDAGPHDAGIEDAGVPDAGTPDAGFHAPFDYVGIVGTGQSLSIGAAAGAPVSSTPSPTNFMLTDDGPAPKFPLDGGGMWRLVPLKEPVRSGITGYTDSQYPANIAGETPHSGLAAQLTALGLAQGAPSYVSVTSVVGWSGHCLVDINKGGNNGSVGRAYPGTLSEARVFKRLAAAEGKTFGYAGITLTHGECDNGNGGYEAGLVKLQSDYETDLQAITGQASSIPLFISQQSTIAPVLSGNMPARGSAIAVWKAGVNNPGKIFTTGPKYQYLYAGDLLHMPAASYRAVGAKYAQVIDAVVNKGEAWQPLQPISATLAGAVITVTFHVPVPPLAFEDSLPAPHQTVNVAWKNGHGFEVVDSTGALSIASAAINGSTVVLTLSAVPTGTGLRVRYALTQDSSGLHGGQALGQMGQLRDSETLISADAQDLTCAVAMGSTSATCVQSELKNRVARDRVIGPGLPAGGAVVTAISGGTATLSEPWTGASGMTTLRFGADLRNYAVHFDLPVP